MLIPHYLPGLARKAPIHGDTKLDPFDGNRGVEGGRTMSAPSLKRVFDFRPSLAFLLICQP
jgi:hypothetical protein